MLSIIHCYSNIIRSYRFYIVMFRRSYLSFWRQVTPWDVMETLPSLNHWPCSTRESLLHDFSRNPETSELLENPKDMFSHGR